MSLPRLLVALPVLLALAVPSPVSAQVYPVRASPIEGPGTVAAFGLEFDQAVPLGAVVHLAVSSCGQLLAERTYTAARPDASSILVFLSPGGEPDLGANEVNNRVGRSVEWALDITEPGAPPYAYSGSYSEFSFTRPSCEVVYGPCIVEKWSRKELGKAKVGATVAVTPTDSVECDETYTWKADRTMVRSGPRRWLNLGKKYRGKKISLVITAAKNGDVKRKTIRFGRVR